MPRKKSPTARFAFIGLIVAAIGCIATGILALVEGTTALKLFTPADPTLITRWLAISAGVLVLGVALYGLLNPAGVGSFLSGRQARFGSNALIMSLGFVGILVVINVLVYQNPKSWDFTEGKQHTLAPQTLQALDTLPGKVDAIAFFSPQSSPDTARQLLNDFKSNSKGKFDYRFVDPNADPVLARQYGVTGDGKIVLVMGKSSETASYADETSLTQAMIRLISPETRVIYFLTGHGEPDINGSGQTSLSRAKETLTNKGYTANTLNLAAENKIPDDAKAVVEAGPTHPLLDQEVAEIKAYLDKGGSLIVLEDPTVFTSMDSGADPLAAYLKSSWGITLQDDVVIDLTSNQPLTAISSSYSTSAQITQHMTTVSIMPDSRSLSIEKTLPESVTVTPLILTSQQSWGETDLASLQATSQIAFDPATDVAGPLTLAASGQNASTNGRVVVFGSSTFATDKGFDVYANGDIFTNSVDWAAQQSELINITPRTPVSRTFDPPAQLPFLAILLGTVVLLPGLVVVAGISSWLSKRRHG
jgi:gliding motility-associatede transport system auxiliary component